MNDTGRTAPNEDGLGARGTWTLDGAEGVTEVEGDLIAFVSTRGTRHNHFERWAPRGGPRCRGCRWFEISIIQTDSKYVMHRIGPSVIPHELPMYTELIVTEDPAELIEQVHHWDKKTGAKTLSGPAQEAIVIAGEYDDAIDEAWRAYRSEAKQVVRRIS